MRARSAWAYETVQIDAATAVAALPAEACTGIASIRLKPGQKGGLVRWSAGNLFGTGELQIDPVSSWATGLTLRLDAPSGLVGRVWPRNRLRALAQALAGELRWHLLLAARPSEPLAQPVRRLSLDLTAAAISRPEGAAVC